MYEIKPPLSEDSPNAKMNYDPVGKPVKHKAADQQVKLTKFLGISVAVFVRFSLCCFLFDVLVIG